MLMLIEIIKRGRKKQLNARLVEHSIFVSQRFYKFNNTRAQMLDSICHMTLKLLKDLISVVKAL